MTSLQNSKIKGNILHKVLAQMEIKSKAAADKGTKKSNRFARNDHNLAIRRVRISE